MARAPWWVLLLGLAGCYEIEDVEEVRTHVAWDEPTDSLVVDMRLVNVGAELFGCTGLDAPACAERVTKAVQVPISLAEADADGWPDFAPARALVKDGSTDVSAKLERGEKGVDLVFHYRAPVGSASAAQTGVYVEREGKPGKEKGRLVVEMAPGRVVSAVAKAHRLRPARGDEGERFEVETLLFAPKVRELELVTRPGDDFTPLLTAFPGLDAQIGL